MDMVEFVWFPVKYVCRGADPVLDLNPDYVFIEGCGMLQDLGCLEGVHSVGGTAAVFYLAQRENA